MSKVAAQLFTVRKHMKCLDDVRSTLHKINEMGYDHIEVSNVKFTTEEAEVIRQVSSKLNMGISSTQMKYKHLMKDFDNIVALHQMWACDYVTVAIMPMKYVMQGEKGIKNFAALLNKLGERFKKNGLKLLYHHHDMEFAKYGDRTGLELLMEETNPLYVNLVLDTYWVQKGGKNPADQIRQFADRVKVVHIRDYKVKLSRWHRDYVVLDAALGQGNLEFAGILNAADEAGVAYVSVEQDTKVPFEDLRISMDHIRSLGR